MAHTHWDEPGHPICDLPTMKACDERWTQYQHGHLGEPCVKAIQESKTKKGQANKLATCTLVRTPERGMSFEQSLAWSSRVRD